MFACALPTGEGEETGHRQVRGKDGWKEGDTAMMMTMMMMMMVMAVGTMMTMAAEEK